MFYRRVGLFMQVNLFSLKFSVSHRSEMQMQWFAVDLNCQLFLSSEKILA